jgi:hypothetical protein
MTERLEPGKGTGTIAGIKLIADDETGLANEIRLVTVGHHFKGH